MSDDFGLISDVEGCEFCPHVSIVVPAFNSEKFIESTIESVLCQTFKFWELIVIDDCSTDNTVCLVSVYVKKYPAQIRLLTNQVNSGSAVSRNKGIQSARGKYIAFLDADDCWVPEKLDLQLAFMEANQIEFCFTAYACFTESPDVLTRVIDLQSKPVVNYEDMLAKRATFGCSTVIVRTDLVGEARMPNIRTGQDYAFWLLLLKMGASAHRLGRVLTHYRVRSDSISANKVKKAIRQWQIYRKLEKIGIFSSIWYFANYAYRAISRR